MDRPPFILTFAADQQGCGFHRIMMPLASLVEAGLADGRVDIQAWPDEAVKACAPDIIVWQRQVEDNQVEAMARWRQLLPNTLFIYELDDYLDDIPPESFHAGFMPRDVKSRIKKALVYCDRITTTTDPMAEWLATLAPKDCRVDVVPNGLPVSRLRERSVRSIGKLRVGFAGGISHTGDLALLRHAMETIGDEVSWVFLGMAPEDPPVTIEYHDGVPATLYLDKMLSLDFDLMLAPLVDNAFNRHKSNLRLVETAAIGAASIAQDLPPYRVRNPPVFTFATTPQDWAGAIRQFIDASKSARQRSVDALRTWAGRYYTLERLLPARTEAWLPEVLTPWRPSAVLPPQLEKLVIASTDRDRLPFLTSLRTIFTGLEVACKTAKNLGADVLWLRPATTFDAGGLDRLRWLLRDHREFASVVPLTNDGSNGFPRKEPWSAMPPEATLTLAKLTGELFGARFLSINAPSGPVILLSLRAILMLGIPDVDGCDGNEEQALMEWGLRGTSRGWKHGQAIGSYAGSTTPPVQPTQHSVTRLQTRGLGEHLTNILPESQLPDSERAQLELRMLRAQWGGPRPGSMGFANDYASWSALRAVQGGPKLRITKTFTDSRFSGGHDVYVRTFGAQKDWPDDAYVLFIDDTIKLQDAVYWFEEVLAQPQHRKAMVLYGDNETLIDGRASPEFKPDFDPTLFLAQDYITPICAVHAGMFVDAPANRIELFHIILDVWDNYGVKAVHHVPRILGSMTIKNEPEMTALETLERQLTVKKVLGERVEVKASRNIIGCLTVTHSWKTAVKEPPLVSIIVPTLGSGRLVQPCVATILQHTAYPNYEVIVVQNGDQRDEPELTEAILADRRVHIVHYSGSFNWSKINNWAISEHAHGSYIVTMNDDVCIGSKQWLDLMMGHAVLPDVGVVGAKLVHPAGVVQHVGVVCHNGIAGHMHKGTPAGQAGHLGRILLAHEAAAATGACMLFSRDNFEAVNGFDTSWPANFNDVVFCIEQRKQGRRIVIETSAELLHPEASSRTESSTVEGMAALKKDNARLLQTYPEADPYWNPNMGLSVSPDNLMIGGLNADKLAWDDFVPQSDSRRVLLVNDAPGAEGCVLDVLRDGNIPFMADLSGFSLQLAAPSVLNVQPWDIRNVEPMIRDLKTLGIDLIMLRSLVGAHGAAPPVEALRVLNTARLGIPVTIQPSDIAYIAPWLVEDGRVNEQRVFGYVDLAAWKAAYENVIATEV